MFRFSPRANKAHLITWHEWGEQAFRAAQHEGKLVVLFLTAFWCGVCQRMDETTLSDDDIIEALNTVFIPIRVEESQHPDIDVRYNQDGWPTIVFLTPEGHYIASVNHLAPEPFFELLIEVAGRYQEAKDELSRRAAESNAAFVQHHRQRPHRNASDC